MPAADIAKLTARVNWIIGSRGSSFDATVSDDRFIQEEIRRALLETEAEVVRALCEGYHPMRTTFLSWSADLTNGSVLPEHIGQVEAVQIKPFLESATYNLAESTSRSNIRDWRENTNGMFDDTDHDRDGSALSGYFNITNETLTFTGYRAQVRICDYSPDYTTPALQVDNQFDGTLIAGTIPRLNKIGVPQALVMSYGQQYASFLALIRQGINEMPTISEAQQSE
jgi:hypothetical protein